MNPNHTTNENQCHSRHRHHTVVHIAHAVAGIGNDLESQQRTTAQQLTNGTHDDEDHGIA